MFKIKARKKVMIPIIAMLLVIVMAGNALASPRLWNNFPTTQNGDTSRRTTLIQRILYEIPGYFTLLSSIDTDFGVGTETQVCNYQYDNSLSNDGIVGPLTWASLESELENARYISIGTGVYKINYDVDGNWCVQVYVTTQSDGTYEYEWLVLDRYDNWKTVYYIYSSTLIID